MPDLFVFIVTGWRGAKAHLHADLIAEELDPIRVAHGVNVLMRHGKCPYGGVDLIADGIARGWGWQVEEFAPEIRDGRVLGSPRNREMCAAEPRAQLVKAFPGPGSTGTWNCLNWARRYDIRFEGRPLQTGGRRG